MRAFLLGSVALAVSGSALAQEAATAPQASGGIEDIVVTAQRRQEAVQDVPIAISAFSTQSLESKGITNTLSLIGYVPNMFGSNNTGLGSANAYYIRGLGNTETIATFDPPVGTYVDDVYLSRQNGNNFSFFDVERVEVLRGPQGTLFGRNTTGGAVNVIMRRPGTEFGGFVEAGYGSYDRWMARGSVDLPMGEMVQFKLSGYYQDDRGYARNTTTGQRTNDSDGSGVRLAMQLKPVERLSWNLALAYTESNGENLLNFDCDPRNPSNCDGRFVTTGMLTNRRLGGGAQYPGVTVSGRKANFTLGNEVSNTLLTSNIEWAGDNHTLNLITGYVDLTQKYALDFADGRGLPNIAVPTPAVQGWATGGFAILNDGTHRQFTQEVKLTGNFGGGFLDYVAGVYFYDESNTTDFADLFTLATLPFPPFTPVPAGFPLVLGDRLLRNKTTATAGYLQVDAHISAQVTATAGIRYTDEEKTFSIRDNRASCIANPAPIGCLNNNLVASNGVAIPLKQRAKIWTPRFALNFKANEDVLLFASATKGFKSGGWNARGTRRDTLLPFDPEIAWSYEAGAKTEWFDNRLRVNLTGFFLDVKALQTPSAFVNPTDGSVTFITQNFADYENKGLELEVTAQPVTGLSLYFNLGWQDDRYKVADTLLPNKYGVKAVRQQQLDCLAQLAAGRVPLAPAGPRNAPDCGAGIIDVNGNIATPVRTPDVTMAFGGSYDFPIPSAGIVIAPSVNFIYRSRLETGTANATIWTGSSTAFDGTVFPANPFGGDFITGSRTDSHWLVNASLSLRTDDENWLLSLECENCFDKVYGQSSLVNYTYLNPPRTWMLRARRKF
jgi:iron complex outermembrane receptor protein